MLRPASWVGVCCQVQEILELPLSQSKKCYSKYRGTEVLYGMAKCGRVKDYEKKNITYGEQHGRETTSTEAEEGKARKWKESR